MVAYVENSARPETWARDTGVSPRIVRFSDSYIIVSKFTVRV